MSSKRFKRGSGGNGPRGTKDRQLKLNGWLISPSEKNLRMLLFLDGIAYLIELLPGRGKQLRRVHGSKFGFSQKPIPIDFFGRLRVQSETVATVLALQNDEHGENYRKKLRRVMIMIDLSDFGHHNPAAWRWGTHMTPDERGEFCERRKHLSTGTTARDMRYRRLASSYSCRR